MKRRNAYLIVGVIICLTCITKYILNSTVFNWDGYSTSIQESMKNNTYNTSYKIEDLELTEIDREEIRRTLQNLEIWNEYEWSNEPVAIFFNPLVKKKSIQMVFANLSHKDMIDCFFRIDSSSVSDGYRTLNHGIYSLKERKDKYSVQIIKHKNIIGSFSLVIQSD